MTGRRKDGKMAQYSYRLYGLRINTDLEFPQLVAEDTENVTERVPEIRIEEGEIPEEILRETTRKYDFGTERSFLSNRTMWMVAEQGDHIRYRRKEGANPFYMRTYLLGYGMAMIAMQRGQLAIHCSAVANAQGAVLIAGESGAGKSTVTTMLLEQGYELMADDMAVVEPETDRTYVYPAFPYQKLCRNVAAEQGYDLEKLLYINEEKDKFLVPYRGTFSTEKRPVKAFILLGLTNGESVQTGEITGIRRFPVYADNLFLRYLLKQEKYNPQIGAKCIAMAATVPTFYIARPAEGDSTVEVSHILQKILGNQIQGS